MLNQMVIIRRLVDEPKLQQTESGKNVLNMTVAVPRSFKNANGQYDTDFVDCVMWEGVAKTTSEYCHKGDVVGIKGRVQTDLYEKDGETRKSTKIIAERVTFLSKEKANEKESVDNPKTKEEEKEPINKSKSKTKAKELDR